MISAISKSMSAARFGGVARLASSFANVNRIELLGKVGWGPFENSLTSDKEKKFVKFSVMTSNVSYSKQGDAKPTHTYHDITVFNPKLFSVAQAVAKDSTVYVKGCLSYYPSKDKEGNKIWRCGVVADDIVPQVSVVQKEDNKAAFLRGSEMTAQEKSEVASEEDETVKSRTAKLKKASKNTPHPQITEKEDEVAKAVEDDDEQPEDWRRQARACCAAE